MKKLFFLILLSAGSLHAEEVITSTSAYIQDPTSTNTLHFISVLFYRGLNPSDSQVIVDLIAGGVRKTVVYSGPGTRAQIDSLNTRDFSTTSMAKTIMNKIITDGRISGTVVGSPD